MIILFWLSIFLLVYPLVIYPLCLLVFPKRHKTKANENATLPKVSMLLSVYNEEKNIRAKIDNFMALEYPAELLELLVISDGSTDGTDEIVRSYGSDRIRLLRQEGRKGKTTALNTAAQEAKGEVLFFTDADSMLAPDCLKLLVLPLADSSVGLTSGRSVYRDSQGRETAGSLYRRFEEWQKLREGRLYGIPGADGAAYALRRSLYETLPPEYINDLLHPVQAVLKGKAALACPEALVSEPSEENGNKSEFYRQTRIMAQSWFIFLRHCKTLAKAKRWGFLWQFVSHKVLRWLALPWLLLLFLSSLSLMPRLMPALALLGIIGLCALGWLGAKEKAGFAGRISLLFMLQGAAGINGLIQLARGNKFVTWQPRGN